MVLVYEADTLKEILRTTWALTGKLAAEGTAAADGLIRPVKFFARGQIKDKIESKAIEVNKETPKVAIHNTEFFTEETDEFKIKVVHKLSGTSKADIDAVEADVEDMEQEIERIIKLTYNPQSGVGVFWSSDLRWTDADELNHAKMDPYIVRVLMLRLTRIIGRATDMFDSFQRGAFFDLSASANMDTPPLADFTYTQVYDIENSEGFRDIELDVTSNPDGVGIPLYYAGRFSGILVMKAYLDDNVIGTTADKINQMDKRQADGEKIEAAIVRTYTNRASQTVTFTTIIRVQNTRIVEGMTGLMTWEILAKILKPTTMVIT